MINILGGEGFVGSGFVRLFQKLGLAHRVINRANYLKYIGSSCEVFINAAGASSKIAALREPMADFEANVRAARAALEDFKGGFYIHLSSCDVYPDCSSPETTREEALIEPAAQSPYGFHKLLGEYCVRHRAADWLIIRQGGFVGPGLKKNAIFDILSGGPLWLDPASELQFLSTDASAAIIWDLYGQGLNREIFNLCGEGRVKLAEALRWAGRKEETEPPPSAKGAAKPPKGAAKPSVAPPAEPPPSAKGAAKPPKGAAKPLVRYEINLDKVKRHAAVPESREAVKSFIAQFKEGRPAAEPIEEP